MAIDNTKLATELLGSVGGKGNITNVVHCATRLRFKLKDESKANVKAAEKIAGVVAVVEKGGQFQVVIGNTVPEVYQEVVKVGGLQNLTEKEESGNAAPKGNILNRFIDTIAGIFPPILGGMCGAGLIKGLLAILTSAKLLNPEMGTYIVLNAVGDAVFYFLPILLGFSAGRKFGGNEYITALIGAALVYPSLVSLAGQQITFLKIPMVLMNYTSSVIPILVSSYVSCRLEKFFRKKLPAAIKNFVTPMLCLIIVVPLTLFIIGPIFLTLSEWLAKGYMALPTVLGGIIVGALWQVLVIFGVHWSFIPVMMNNITTMGYDPLSSAAQAAAMSQTGAAFGMFLKMKNKDQKGMTFSTIISGIFGITEPIVYGVTLPRKKPFIMGVIGGACGGAVGGIIGGVHYAMGAFGVLCLPSTIHPQDGFGKAFWGTLAGLVVSFVVAAVLTFITYKDDTVVAEGPQNSELPAELDPVSSGTTSEIKMVYSPMNGTAVSLSKSKDPVHAQEALGKGALVIPSEGKVYAPFNGRVAIVYDTKHAIGLISDDGVELLIHVGMDTVKLNGKYFTSYIGKDDRITTGQLLLEFDIDKLQAEGYELESPIIVTNTPDYQSILNVSGDIAKKGSNLLEVR